MEREAIRGRLRRPRGGPRSGGVLVFALVTVLTVGVLAASYAQMTSAVTRRQARAVDTKQAFYLAEAGLAEAFAGMMIGKSGDVGSEQEPAIFGNGLFWVEAEDAGLDHVRLESTAMSGAGRAHLSLVVEKGSMDFGRLGVFTDADVSIPGGVLIDGFDSRKGTYLSQMADATPILIGGVLQPTHTAGQLGHIGTNGDVTVTEPLLATTEVYANVETGTEGELVVVGAPTLEGEVTARTESVFLPQPYVPAIPQEPPLVHEDGLTLVLPPGDAAYESLSVGASSSLVIQGPARLVVGSFQVLNYSSLTFDTTLGPVELYVSGPMTLSSNSTVATSSKDPSQVRVFGTGTDPIILRSSADFYGMVYAALAPVTLGPNFELFGSLSASALSIASGVKVHFDQYLKHVGAKVGLPCKLSWRIVSLDSPVPGGSAGIDPFHLLGLDPTTLLAPALAHADCMLDIRYVDLGGTPQTYVGLESLFDWSQVQSVTSGTRNGVSLRTVWNYFATMVPLN